MPDLQRGEQQSSEPPEVRYERLRPAELRAIAAQLSLAYVPMGPLEFHGEHLPLGVDAFEAHGLCMRAAHASGGVVLPPAYLASGCLDLPYTIDYDNAFIHAWATATLGQLARRGFRAAVIVTGHGPLDLNHLLKRVCREVGEANPGFAAIALCWLELNAARLTSPEADEPTTVDHAARIETSWMLALEPDLVRLDRLADDPAAGHLGVYGPNPRFTASAAFGEDQLTAGSALLATRAMALVAGEKPDQLADLRTFVLFGWPERPLLAGDLGHGVARLLITNPGRASRYLSSLSVEIDGFAVSADDMVLTNHSVGESGIPIKAADLDAEHGFYVRCAQTADVVLAGVSLAPGPHRVKAVLGLGGVTALELDEVVDFSAP